MLFAVRSHPQADDDPGELIAAVDAAEGDRAYCPACGEKVELTSGRFGQAWVHIDEHILCSRLQRKPDEVEQALRERLEWADKEIDRQLEIIKSLRGEIHSLTAALKDDRATYTSTEAAEELGVHVNTLIKWERDGHLPITVMRTPGGQRRFTQSDVDAIRAAMRAVGKTVE